MTISLRPATLDDAEAVVLLHLQCHEEAYGRHLPPEFFEERRKSLPGRVESFRKAMELGNVPTLAYDGGGLVGVAESGPAQEDDAPVSLELRWIYTLERVHGTGAGQALSDAVIGTQAAYLWVLEDNPRAQAFYVRNGFVPDGARKLMNEQWHFLPNIRMVRAAVNA
ncbi:GNAT family N-acetyltransferase [Arthrobacter sp. GMC3]|uniref:GNAT family N-acetyltransferase n=1 Tax=Arthrobacter sp. GMC3 TaxID=2058894 RepID=UPI000CE36858|nr:GNAT family N-acetyltransferase [Arthrobacter sp. GMC3]